MLTVENSIFLYEIELPPKFDDFKNQTHVLFYVTIYQ